MSLEAIDRGSALVVRQLLYLSTEREGMGTYQSFPPDDAALHIPLDVPWDTGL